MTARKYSLQMMHQQVVLTISVVSWASGQTHQLVWSVAAAAQILERTDPTGTNLPTVWNIKQDRLYLLCTIWSLATKLHCCFRQWKWRFRNETLNETRLWKRRYQSGTLMVCSHWARLRPRQIARPIKMAYIQLYEGVHTALRTISLMPLAKTFYRSRYQSRCRPMWTHHYAQRLTSDKVITHFNYVLKTIPCQ